MPLIALALLPATAQEFDVNASTFWVKGYAIPLAYSTTRFTFPAKDFSALSKAIAPCSWSQVEATAVVAFARCRTEAKTEEALLRKIRALHPLLDRSERLSIPEYPELAFKQEALAKELPSLEEFAERIPTIRGVIQAQMATLDDISHMHEAAKHPAVEILVVESTSTDSVEAGLMARPNMSKREQERERPMKAHWTQHFARVAYPVCEQTPVVFVTRDAPLAEENDRSLRVALGSGVEEYHENGCRFGSPSIMYLTELPYARLEARLKLVKGVTGVRYSPMMRYKRDLTDLERFDALSSELRRQETLLSTTPTIRAFIHGELERIRPAADGLRKLRGRLLVVVVK